MCRNGLDVPDGVDESWVCGWEIFKHVLERLGPEGVGEVFGAVHVVDCEGFVLVGWEALLL